MYLSVHLLLSLSVCVLMVGWVGNGNRNGIDAGINVKILRSYEDSNFPHLSKTWLCTSAVVEESCGPGLIEKLHRG